MKYNKDILKIKRGDKAPKAVKSNPIMDEARANQQRYKDETAARMRSQGQALMPKHGVTYNAPQMPESYNQRVDWTGNRAAVVAKLDAAAAAAAANAGETGATGVTGETDTRTNTRSRSTNERTFHPPMRDQNNRQRSGVLKTGVIPGVTVPERGWGRDGWVPGPVEQPAASPVPQIPLSERMTPGSGVTRLPVIKVPGSGVLKPGVIPGATFPLQGWNDTTNSWSPTTPAPAPVSIVEQPTRTTMAPGAGVKKLPPSQTNNPGSGVYLPGYMPGVTFPIGGYKQPSLQQGGVMPQGGTEDMVMDFAMRYLTSMGVAQEEIMDQNGNINPAYEQELSQAIQEVDNPDFWNAYAQSPDAVVAEYIQAKNPEAVAMARKGAKLRILNSYRRKK